MHISNNIYTILYVFSVSAYHYLYYKEQRQLKTFFTQFGSVLPLTPDPPVRLRDDQKVERP
jgi:hypothetical protein